MICITNSVQFCTLIGRRHTVCTSRKKSLQKSVSITSGCNRLIIGNTSISLDGFLRNGIIPQQQAQRYNRCLLLTIIRTLVMHELKGELHTFLYSTKRSTITCLLACLLAQKKETLILKPHTDAMKSMIGLCHFLCTTRHICHT